MAEKLDLIKIKAEMVERRRALLAQLHAGDGDDDEKSINPDRAELAQDYDADSLRAAFDERAEETLEHVENALARLENGTYGQCSHCGGPIPPARLIAMPYVEMCIECQREEEHMHPVR